MTKRVVVLFYKTNNRITFQILKMSVYQTEIQRVVQALFQIANG